MAWILGFHIATFESLGSVAIAGTSTHEWVKMYGSFLYGWKSKNRGTVVRPKWMVYNGKAYQNGWFGGTTIFGNIHMRKWRDFSKKNAHVTLKKGVGYPFFWSYFAVQNFWSQNLGVVKVSALFFWRIIFNSSTGWFFSVSSLKRSGNEHLNTWDIFTTKQIDLACQLLVLSWFSKPILSQWCRRHPFPGHSELDIWSLKNTD